MYDAILSSEDKNFYKHGGIDLVGTVSAVYDNVARPATPAAARRSASSTSRTSSSSAANRTRRRSPRRRTARRSSSRPKNRPSRTATPTRRRPRAPRASSASSRRCATRSPSSRSTRRTRSCSATSTSPNFGGTNYGIDAAARYYFGVAAKDLTRRPGRGSRRHGAEPELVPHRHAGRLDDGFERAIRSTARPTATSSRRIARSTCSTACSPTARSPRSSTTPPSPSRSRPPSPPPKTGCAFAALGGVLLPVRQDRSSRTTPPSARRPRTASKALQRGGLNDLHDAGLPRVQQAQRGRDQRRTRRRRSAA